nr:MAG TPA: hypothetical protein [Bacteriophage sp.]
MPVLGASSWCATAFSLYRLNTGFRLSFGRLIRGF